MSNSLQQLERSATLFLDRTHQSKQMARLLKSLGINVELHKDHFHQEAPDPEWIPICAERGWAILTGDKGIEYDGLNRKVVIESAAKVFILRDCQLRGLEWAAALITGRHKILRTIVGNTGPFYCEVDPANESHIGRPTFYGAGHAIPQEKVPEYAIAAPVEVRAPASRKSRRNTSPQQLTLDK